MTLLLLHFEGFQPEWYTSTIYHWRDIPFWLESLDLLPWLKSCREEGKGRETEREREREGGGGDGLAEPSQSKQKQTNKTKKQTNKQKQTNNNNNNNNSKNPAKPLGGKLPRLAMFGIVLFLCADTNRGRLPAGSTSPSMMNVNTRSS